MPNRSDPLVKLAEFEVDFCNLFLFLYRVIWQERSLYVDCFQYPQHVLELYSRVGSERAVARGWQKQIGLRIWQLNSLYSAYLVERS